MTAVGRCCFSLLVGWGCLGGCSSSGGRQEWPLWQSYRSGFILPEGRVVDPMIEGATTSEGQAYAMFFALVAGDRSEFDRLLAWSERHLAGGSFERHLPAWKWGRNAAGTWGVLDENSASDADLWMAYDLLEAARLWREPAYAERAERLLGLILEREVRALPGLGWMVLPGMWGGELKPGVWRLNPSYLPLFLLRRLAVIHPESPWPEVERNALVLLRRVQRDGVVADWVAYDEKQGFVVDPERGAVSSYDAIRVYLWAGMLDDADARKLEVLQLTDGLYRRWRGTGVVAERINLADGPAAALRPGPPGFVASLLPQARSLGNDGEREQLRAWLESRRVDGLYGRPPAYYDQNLALFGTGIVDGHYRIAVDGRLEPQGWVK